MYCEYYTRDSQKVAAASAFFSHEQTISLHLWIISLAQGVWLRLSLKLVQNNALFVDHVFEVYRW